MNILLQHRALYCYLALSLWIFVLVLGLYRYIGLRKIAPYQPLQEFKTENPIETQPLKNDNLWFDDIRFEKIHKACHPTSLILPGSENAVGDNFTLEGIVIVFRHGDRGPMNHVRNLNSISCSYSDDSNITTLYKEYMSFISTYWSNQAYNTLFQFLGQSNTHPPVPSSKQCDIGQLSLQGVMQHLKLGSILRSSYFNRLFNNASQINGNIVTYTTKYRRTFQSLNAFLYGFLKTEGFFKIPLFTVSSMYYCFEDCACPARDRYLKASISENNKRIKSNSDVLKLVEELSSIVYTFADGSFIKDPHYLRDALLAYLCHNTQLPCISSRCVNPDQAIRIFSYVDWDIQQVGKSLNRQKYCILSAYGFIKNIVSHLLKIVSNEKPKIVLYSAHDKTMQFLLTALGIIQNEAVFPPYASRSIFEVYVKKQKDNPLVKKFYFRLIFNGKDQTQRIKFCNGKNRTVFITEKLSKLYVCSFESLIRFLHDDYFLAFNSTNFKDACTNSKN